jgi:hypothetical protein
LKKFICKYLIINYLLFCIKVGSDSPGFIGGKWSGRESQEDENVHN